MSGQPARTPAPPRSTRLDSIDFLRGLVMVIMALDHTRDFFHVSSVNPQDPTRAGEFLFLTRWITHFCAPTFVFLAGVGAFLAGQRLPSRDSLSRFLFTRGLWLVLLEMTLVRFGWFFNLDYHFTFGQVIWAIGWSMTFLAFLVWMPSWAVGLIGVAIVAGHNALDRVPGSEFGHLAWLWDLLKTFRAFDLTDELKRITWLWDLLKHLPGSGEHSRFVYFNAYPVLPWFGVMAAGYGFGMALRDETAGRRKLCFAVGVLLTLAFVLLRWDRRYGDPTPWPQFENRAVSAMAFLNCQKYPPSLLFVLMTIGPALMVLALAPGLPRLVTAPFVTFGRVPLFYYLLHVYLIHGLAVAVAHWTHRPIDWLFANPLGGPAPGSGYDLRVVYLIWIGVVVVLYPPCHGYALLKRRRPGGLLSYL